MNRIYHPYWLWEDYNSGMYSKLESKYESEAIQRAVLFTSDHVLYGNAMNRVINEYKISCENNLTNSSINKRAWIGHAACCIELKLPEHIIRLAWHKLTEQQRIDANKEADYYISLWEEKRKHNNNNDNQLKLPFYEN